MAFLTNTYSGNTYDNRMKYVDLLIGQATNNGVEITVA